MILPASLFKISRHHFMKDVNIFLPEPGNQKASIAVSAIARGMKETNKVAIVRCVWRNGQENVVIGVLTPNISSSDKIVSISSSLFIFYFIYLIYFSLHSIINSQIHFISMHFLLPRMSESFSFHLSVNCVRYINRMQSSKRLQMLSSRCWTSHLLAVRNHLILILL